LNTLHSLSESELDELSDFLISDKCPESSMLIDTLDGFLASIVLTPVTIMATRWLPWVWDMDEGEVAPRFESVEEANHIIGLVMRYYNMTVSEIEKERFEPLFLEMPQRDGSLFFDAEGWCEGFMFGVDLLPEHWQSVVQQQPVLIEPMILLGTENGLQILEGEEGDDPQKIREIYETIPVAIVALREFFLPQREREIAAIMRSVDQGKPKGFGSTRSAQNHGSKVDRNDPCPCGSGKKYKKCCGMGERLH
jgi:uncharacterized protein